MFEQPQVINVRVQHLRRSGFSNLRSWLDADPVKHVYIGRQCPYVDGATTSVWHNPYPISKYGVDESLRLYENHIRAKLWGSLPELHGKILGCWCVPDSPCHGQVLQRLVREHYSLEGGGQPSSSPRP